MAHKYCKICSIQQYSQAIFRLLELREGVVRVELG